MNKILVFALAAAAAFATSSTSAEARDSRYSRSYGYRSSQRTVVVVRPNYGCRPVHSYVRVHRDYYADRCHHHHHSHGVRCMVRRIFR
jgi:hypothetical protein